MPQKITVTFVCGEDFSQMPRAGGKLHCSRCEREITGFRSLPLEEVSRVKAEKGPGCGLFSPDQVQFEKPYTRPGAVSWLRNGLSALVALALLDTASLQAQNTSTLPKDKIVPRHALVIKEPVRQERKSAPVKPPGKKPVTAPKTKKKRKKHRKYEGMLGIYL